MKKTIREDQERFIMKSELLNDNTLLEYVAEHGNMIVGVRYIESPISGIKEDILINMDIVEFMKHQEELLEINEDKTGIAIFKPSEEGYYSLIDVYDTVEHQFGIQDFIDLEYEKRFKDKPLVGQYYKRKQ